MLCSTISDFQVGDPVRAHPCLHPPCTCIASRILQHSLLIRNLLKLTHISLVQFKNYLQTSFSFNERIVALCGPNGIGKTNLLDAIYYLCFTKSYFSKTDIQNVYSGLNGFRIEGNFQLNNQSERIVCILRETGRKEFILNDDTYTKVSRHIGKFPCVIIAPDDVAIITEGGEQRRKFLDALLSQLDNTYLQNLIDYNKVLQQRNGYLKSIAEKRVQDKSLLEVYDQQLMKYGQLIFETRQNFLRDFIPEVTSFYKHIAQVEEKIELAYESQMQRSSFENLLQQFRDKDILYQRTHGGVHRDDLSMSLNGHTFKNIASQGQRKSLLFALKLAEFHVLKTSKNFAPLLLLDDVFEKLDEQRMHNLLDWVCVQNEGQIFISDTHPERIQQHFGKLGVGFQLIGLPGSEVEA
ncbi:MAG TPA: DNA replication and repair protein RecF [Flavitalea sp.]|nr:DNA replication and repair protein RecF [Flavitalea sp.]